jgi:hypothetical protein
MRIDKLIIDTIHEGSQLLSNIKNSPQNKDSFLDSLKKGCILVHSLKNHL